MIDEHFLTDEQIETYRMMIAMDGPNPEIEEILEKDRARRIAWRLVERDSKLMSGARLSGPDASSVPATMPVTPICSPLEASTKPISGIVASAAVVPTAIIPLPDSGPLERAIATVRLKGSRELRDNLAKLVGALHPHAVKKKSHDEVRRWIWAINAVLTERDEIAPCVRAQPSLGGFVPPSSMTEMQTLMLNDRQMFDLQFAHKHRLGKPKRKWEALLRSEPFDLVLAATFIKKVGSPDKKVDALRLRDDEQMLLAAIRSEKIRKRWKRLEEDADRLADQLQAAIATRASRMTKTDCDLWREEYVALVLADGRPAQAAVLLRRLYARSKPANQLANRKADLRDKGFPVD